MSPRDPERRQRIIEAACELLPEVGVSGLTHRRVAAAAGVPLGSTTYYFANLDELTDTALAYAADLTKQGLRDWAQALDASTDLPATLAALTADYLAQRDRMLTANELYLAATRQPALRPLARTWFDGLVEVLVPHVGPAPAHAMAIFIDGTLLHALTTEQPLDAATLTQNFAALANTTVGAEYNTKGTR